MSLGRRAIFSASIFSFWTSFNGPCFAAEGNAIFCETKEAPCLKAAEKNASRAGDVLKIQSDNGAIKTYVSTPKLCDSVNEKDIEGCYIHTLAAVYPVNHAILVQSSRYECGTGDLINLETGAIVALSTNIADAHFSPDGKYVVSTDENVACDTAYQIAIWSWLGDSPKQVYSTKPVFLGVKFKRWIDKDHIEFEADAEDAKNGQVRQKAILGLSKNGWKLTSSDIKSK